MVKSAHELILTWRLDAPADKLYRLLDRRRSAEAVIAPKPWKAPEARLAL
jgi:hypothetical protein